MGSLKCLNCVSVQGRPNGLIQLFRMISILRSVQRVVAVLLAVFLVD